MAELLPDMSSGSAFFSLQPCQSSAQRDGSVQLGAGRVLK